MDWLTDNWDQPEEGIWETRGGRKDFTYGRLMSWVALDRGVRLATAHGRPAPLDRWVAQRDAIYRQIMERGWNSERQAFVQQYDDRVLDSSLLRMSSVGFVSPHDPMWASTLRAMDEELVTDSLVYRYDPEASPDGLRGSEGTFSLCTFTYVDALARAGRVDDARLVFEKMLTYANHLGLYSEEIALTGEQIGNFPQAFTHLALIDAAITLDSQLDLRAGGGAAATGLDPDAAHPRPGAGRGRRAQDGRGRGGLSPPSRDGAVSEYPQAPVGWTVVGRRSAGPSPPRSPTPPRRPHGRVVLTVAPQARVATVARAGRTRGRRLGAAPGLVVDSRALRRRLDVLPRRAAPRLPPGGRAPGGRRGVLRGLALFTSAASLQWLETVNADRGPGPRPRGRCVPSRGSRAGSTGGAAACSSWARCSSTSRRSGP